ncbi:hypothetical protein R5R35_001148 [Gryllus longicercus]|uniref:CHK kinase-like domain-containing protein n=1 Tax=Gryllus longicercus TaxID=2509291 RepID=A0AAN9Z9J2_9ORTH
MVETQQGDERQRDIPPPPSWLDKGLIQQALCNGGEENLQVAALDVTLPIPSGENYSSTIYRAKATLTDGQHRSFIVKGPSPGATLANMSSEGGVFQREAELLGTLIPQMQALLEDAAPGRFPPLAPRCYHHGTSPVEFLVLEDLTPAGFKMANRKRGLGLRHSLLALRTLARFHAASHALLRRQPELAEKLGNTWRAMYNTMETFVKGEMGAAAEACRSWPGCEDYADRLDKFKVVAIDKFTELNDAKPGAFNVITHGDYWVNNMMFRYEEGELKEFRAVDLQMSHAASPAIDLIYFLSSSVSDLIHEHHQDLLLREYHWELKETLELLGLQSPSLEALLAAVDLHGPFSLFMAPSRAIVRAEKPVDMNAMFEGDHSSLLTLYEHAEVKKWMQRVLPDYASRGWLPA